MQVEDEQQKLKMLEKIRGLLAKAESTEYPHEAEALTVKAQMLMATYAIDEARLRRDAIRSGAAVPSQRTVYINRPYIKQKAHLLSRIADANQARVVWNPHSGEATVFGFDADLDFVEILYTSLLTQAVVAMQAAEHDCVQAGVRSFRSSFLYAFGMRLGQRLAQRTEHAVHEAGTGLDLVLASQAEVVDRAVANAHPDVRRSRASASDPWGWAAGTEAGARADLGGRHGQIGSAAG